jgi:Tol biopolymer transport system component
MSVPAGPPSPPPGTDIYELAFGGTLDGLKSIVPQPVATDRGYDNQPFYTPDGRAILFTTNRDGKQTDIYEFDRNERKARPLTATPEGEYSPTVMPDGAGVSVIRVESDGTQRLWRFDRTGSNPQVVLTEIKPVGYHAWIDREMVALFVLGKPSTLQVARVATGKAEVVAREIGRSLHRIPGGRLISFVQREPSGEYFVKQLDTATTTMTPLVKAVAGSAERDCAWLPDGTLLMSSGTKIFAWRRGDADWREVADVASHKLGVVTRMAAAADGKTLAIVVNEP